MLKVDYPSLTMDQVLRAAAARWGAKTYLHDLATDRRYSFGDIDQITRRMAGNLARLGMGKGVHVALLMNNSADLLLLYMALARVGAVVAPINPAAPVPLLTYYLQLCAAEAVIADADCAAPLAEALSDLPPLRAMVLRGEGGFAESLPFDALMAEGEDLSFDVRFADPACLALTSGTTGPSKAVLFTQATMLLVAESYAEAYGYGPDDIYYICLPLFHTSGLRGAAWVALLCGAAVALAPNFSVSRFWEDIDRSGATTFDLLGAMATFLWQAPPHPKERSHRVRMVRMAPVPTFGRAFETRFATRIVSTYGLTDAAAPVARTLEDPPEAFFASGKLRPGFELAILDGDDLPLPPGQTGEIAIRATQPWLMPSGYFRNPEAQAAQWRNGWFHTGDLGWLDAEGYLHFAGRAKEVIRRRGQNISAWEVERFLSSLSGVREAAVYPVASRHGEEEVAVSLVLEGTTLEEVLARCQAGLLPYMVPGQVEIRAALPLTPSQKIDKAQLRREAEAVSATRGRAEAP